jgi:two-component system, OmpR family, sensor histidine kinase KdpD
MKPNKPSRGRLTIFLGAASGVGKTYAMLTAAGQARAKGTDVVVGWMEEQYHETQQHASSFGFRIISYKKTHHRGRTLLELDTQAILNARPDLVLIDQLEHVADSGTHSSKRYHDIGAILAQGIHVYTTLNIQHVESLNDLVTQIIGSQTAETVPDTFLDEAHIQLVDLEAEALIQRVEKGLFVTGMTEEHRQFYRAGNINALREMTFRYAAQRVDNQLEQYMQAKNIAGPWPVSEKLMVCVSASPFSAQLLRIGRQMAAALKSEWIAVYVQTPNGPPQSTGTQNLLSKNLQLAEELGAEVITVTGVNVAEELLALSRSRNVKQIIMGKPARSRLADWLCSSVVEQVIRSSSGVSIHVIPAATGASKAKESAAQPHKPFSFRPYVRVALMVVFMTIALRAFGMFLDLSNIALLFITPVLFSAVYGGMGPSIFAAVTGILALDFFFVPPHLSFTVSDLRYLISFAVYLAVAALTASLAARLRQQMHFARQREANTAALYALSKQITATSGMGTMLENIAKQVSRSVDAEAAIYLPNEKAELELLASSGSPVWGRNEAQMVIAKWVYLHGKMAGKGSGTLGESSGLYVPLSMDDQIYGVLALNLAQQDFALSTGNILLLEAIGGLAASAIDRVKLSEQAQIAHLTAESEKLRTALLDSVSHELRTPLATIIGSATGLIEGETLFQPADRLELLSTIKDGALRMNRLVTNLLGMVKLESGMLRINKKWCDVEDILGVVLAQVKDFQQHRHIRVSLPDPTPYILADDVLLEQVMVNVVSNSIKYSPDYSEIMISVKQQDHNWLISVADNGVGIAVHERQRIFDKFYRSDATAHLTGTGLGLAICKGIVELHSGSIEAESNQPKGTVMIITLPAGEMNVIEEMRFKGEDGYDNLANERGTHSDH